MKKTLKIMSIFLLMIMMLGVFNNSNNIKAISDSKQTIVQIDAVTGYSPITADKKKEAKHNSEVIGRVTVTSGGQIDIEYKYGFADMIILAESCVVYADEGKSCSNFDYEDLDSTQKRSSYVSLIHVAGAKNSSGLGKKTVHLFDYFNYDKIVRISLFTIFFEATEDSTLTCEPNSTNLTYCMRPMKRMENFFYKGETRRVFDYSAELTQMGLYLNTSNALFTKQDDNAFMGSTSYVETDGVTRLTGQDNANAIYVLVNNTKMTGDNEANDMIYDTIIPALLIILAIAAGVSIAVLGYQIVKSADEPEERKQKIKMLIGIMVGIGIVAIILLAIEPISNLIIKNME